MAASAVIKNEEVGKNLEELIGSLNLTPQSVAEKCDLTASKVSAIQKGGDPKLSELVQLAGALDYTPGGLVAKITRNGK